MKANPIMKGRVYIVTSIVDHMLRVLKKIAHEKTIVVYNGNLKYASSF